MRRGGARERCCVVKRYDMALPIAATPVLEGKCAESFFKKIKDDLRNPVHLAPTPNAERAKSKIEQLYRAEQELSDK